MWSLVLIPLGLAVLAQMVIPLIPGRHPKLQAAWGWLTVGICAVGVGGFAVLSLWR